MRINRRALDFAYNLPYEKIMKPELQRIKIAEVCGKQALSVSAVGLNQYADLRPDYLNDLNAMVEAFGKLGRHWEISQVHDGYYCRIEYGRKGQDVITGGLELLPVMAEAFLRTLNLWEESA